MRQPATGITQNLGNRNRKKDRTAVQFSSVLWIFSVHRTEPANTIDTTLLICESIVPGRLGPTLSNKNMRDVGLEEGMACGQTFDKLGWF
jgi:hypothetical protein